MNCVSSISFKSSLSNVNQQKSDSLNKKTLSKPAQVFLGTTLMGLAAGGVYIATKSKGVSIDNAFKLVQNSASYMDVLKTLKMQPKDFKQLMFRITSDEKTSEKFIKEVISNPRKSKENVRILNKKIGGDNELMDWMLRPNGYQESYYKYTKKAFNDAKHPDDLIKTSPNWNIWKLTEKFGTDFTIGQPPQGVSGGVDGYRNTFYQALSNSNAGFESGGMKFGDYIGGGLSGKAVRKVEIGDKQYIMKFQPELGNQNLKDDISMKSDSTFINAQIDRYLELNDSKKGPKLVFFDYKTNSTLYELTEGVAPNQNQINDILELNKTSLKGLNDIGIYYNDVNTGNFRVNDNNMSFIDSGESSFVDFFKPGVAAYHFTLPNLNGRSISDTAAAINLAK